MHKSLIVLDNGASTVKVGVIGRDFEPRIIPNAVIRSKGDKMTYFGHEFAECKDFSSLHYRLPFEKGYLVDWDAQKAVWDGIFSDQVLGVDTTQSSLLITEPYFNLPNIQEVYDQLIFEEYEFSSYHRCTSASVIPYGRLFSQHLKPGVPPPDCAIVVDSGFSFTHVVPMIDGEIVWNAVKRLDVGGKLLTNHLKELVSFRQWNMMDETYIMNHIKETCCFVSTDYDKDMETCRADPKHNLIVQEYVLPDLTTHRKGRVRHAEDIITETDQILVMNNERFTVPELLFRPDDIGLDQGGLPLAIASSISLLPDDLQGMFWANIGVVGGNAKFPGFHERLFSELRAIAPADYEVVVHISQDPITEVYKSAYKFAVQSNFARQHVVTREEYAEMGSNASLRKFRDWRPQESENETENEHEIENGYYYGYEDKDENENEKETEKDVHEKLQDQDDVDDEEMDEEEEEEEEEGRALEEPIEAHRKAKPGKQETPRGVSAKDETNDRSQAPARTRSTRAVAGTSAASVDSNH